MDQVKYLALLEKCTQSMYDAAFHSDTQWTFQSTSQDVTIYDPISRENNEHCYISKVEIEVPADMDTVVGTLFDVKRAQEYDTNLLSLSFVEQLTDNVKVTLLDGTVVDFGFVAIYHTKYNGFWPLFSNRDCVHLFAFGVCQRDGKRVGIQSLISIPDEDASGIPVESHYIRATMHESGAIIQQCDTPDTCLLQMVTNVNMGGWVPSKVLQWASHLDVSSTVLFRKCAEARKGQYVNIVDDPSLLRSVAMEN